MCLLHTLCGRQAIWEHVEGPEKTGAQLTGDLSKTTASIIYRMVLRPKWVHVTMVSGLIVVSGTMVLLMSSWCIIVGLSSCDVLHEFSSFRVYVQ
jgi:hypothetical protein